MEWGTAVKSVCCEMSYLSRACGVTRCKGESNESMYVKCGMGPYTTAVKCGVVEWVKKERKRGGLVKLREGRGKSLQ